MCALDRAVALQLVQDLAFVLYRASCLPDSFPRISRILPFAFLFIHFWYIDQVMNVDTFLLVSTVRRTLGHSKESIPSPIE